MAQLKPGKEREGRSGRGGGGTKTPKIASLFQIRERFSVSVLAKERLSRFGAAKLQLSSHLFTVPLSTPLISWPIPSQSPFSEIRTGSQCIASMLHYSHSKRLIIRATSNSKSFLFGAARICDFNPVYKLFLRQPSDPIMTSQSHHRRQ